MALRFTGVGRAKIACVAALGAVLALFVPATLAYSSGTVSGDLGTSSQSQTGRPTFSSTSTCQHTPATSVVGTAKTRHYLGYIFNNSTGEDECMTVGYAATADVTVAMYFGSFDAAHPGQNLVGGHATGSSCSSTSGSFTVLVPANANFEVVVSECAPGGGGSFQFQVNGECACASIGVYQRKGSGSWTRSDLSATVARGSSVTFGIRVVNGGQLDETLLLRPDGGDVAGYRVKYFHGKHDITDAMNAGNYTVTLKAGGEYRLKAIVKVLSSAAQGSSINRTIEGIATANGAQASEDVSFTVYRK